ncbi:hypothetical protein D8Y22_01615 [Salinadaptatus halalkaliphilus]|uniref:DUF7998 domain-containing protein n=1 Tax=Salinadaptatus halalkaliphilus TaxID=2419781 RepID=A0A4S3TR11_9EURY|nr:hypothetical protein [Salinadaptatus halalkaliphilus]THE66844.1 hypothetical protein D8Y22_01615 [Salinadaptatus halalkaliphilus]
MFGKSYWGVARVGSGMNPFSSGRFRSDDGTEFDSWRKFDAETIPDPGPFLEGQTVLEGDAHAAFHRLTRDLFEERGVYDATFGYNLARLNLDRRHPEAGYRYAIDTDEATVLRAEFTPTTEFCPQAEALVKGSLRAWNGLADRHEYDHVRVRVHPSHHRAEPLNESLTDLEATIRETGTVPDPESTSHSAPI